MTNKLGDVSQASSPITHKSLWSRIAGKRESKTDQIPTTDAQTSHNTTSKAKGAEVKTHNNILWHAAKYVFHSLSDLSHKDKADRRASAPADVTSTTRPPHPRHASVSSAVSLPDRPAEETKPSGRDLLSAASRQAWTSRDPGPNLAAKYYAEGYAPPVRAPVEIIEETDFGLETKALPPRSATPSYEEVEIPGTITDLKDAPSRQIAAHMQRYHSATQAYQRTNALEACLQANPSSSVYLSRAQEYLNISARTDLDDVSRIGHFNNAMTSAKYAVSMGSIEGATMLWNMNREGLRGLRNPTLNIDSSPETTLWFKVSNLLNNTAKLENIAKSFLTSSYGHSPLLTNPQKADQIALLIYMSSIVHPQDKSYGISHAKQWVEELDFTRHAQTTHPAQTCGITHQAWNAYKLAIQTHPHPWERF